MNTEIDSLLLRGVGGTGRRGSGHERLLELSIQIESSEHVSVR